jgi:hypothetical protein
MKKTSFHLSSKPKSSKSTGKLARFLIQPVSLLATLSPAYVTAQGLELFIDQKTNQVFAAPGAGRVSLGSFCKKGDDACFGKSEAASSVPAKVDSHSAPSATPSAHHTSVPPTVAPVAGATPAPIPWYQKAHFRGYTQVRHTSILGGDGPDLSLRNDRSANKDQSLMVRRSRIVLSGDATDRLFFYLQPELFASTGGSNDFSVQMRDAYGDIALDPKKESRIRVGQSIVPFGFTNLQSTRYRLPLERPQASNSAAEGERDVGLYYMWAPAEIRERFKFLGSTLMKGSGDFGVLAVGAYTGQGLNKGDKNNEPHGVARLAYPFQFANGQIFEPSISGYVGKFVSPTAAYTDENGDSITPTEDKKGVSDRRGAISAVLYPQPFGAEFEWNFGEGPELVNGSSIEAKPLQGGHVLFNYHLLAGKEGHLFPFARWQYFEGGRKFANNAPAEKVREWSLGAEYTPIPDLRLTLEYAQAAEFTNTSVAPYDTTTDSKRIGAQVQVNY